MTPLLGDMPVVGALFRSVRYERSETELVVLVTPRLVEPMNPDQVRHAAGRDVAVTRRELELFLDRDIGSVGGRRRQAPKTDSDGRRRRRGATADNARRRRRRAGAVPRRSTGSCRRRIRPCRRPGTTSREVVAHGADGLR